MPLLSKVIVSNVGEEYIKQYLKGKGLYLKNNIDEKGINYYVDELFADNKVDVDDFEIFLFNELFYGRRKYTRVYQLDNASRLANPVRWQEKYKKIYNVDKLNFNNILGSVANKNNPLMIAASVEEMTNKGVLNNLKILFSCYAEVNTSNGYEQSGMYYPVEIDFDKELVFIRGWSRQGLVDNYKTEAELDHIFKIMELSFDIRTKRYLIDHKKVLYNMSQGVITDIYNKIPSYRNMNRIENYVKNLTKSVVTNLPLENRYLKDNEYQLCDGVLDFEDEINKVIEKLCVSDFFFDLPYEKVWEMGIDTIISRIRFNDTEHVLTSLNGESSELPIFCTKTFMALKKSLEESEVVERLWIQNDRKKGKLSIAYDATNDDYLGIRILSNIRFKEEDFVIAKEIYKKYERGIVTSATADNQEEVV